MNQSPSADESMVMPEAEVSLRLAFWLFAQRLTEGPVDVALDGAQVRTSERVHFDLALFLAQHGWNQPLPAPRWQCDWFSRDVGILRIHSNPGRGDVVARLRSGATLRVECKKGSLTRSKNSAEYPLMREALGQLLTITEVSDRDILAIAVPHSPKFEDLAIRWRAAPLIGRFGFQILTVARDGQVRGFDATGVG